MTNNIIFNKWLDYHYKINNQILTHQQISSSLESLFFTFANLPNNFFIIIQFKIKIDNDNIRSISYVQTVKLNQLNDLINIFIEFWNIRSEDYHIINVDSIIYTYKIIDSNNIIKESILNKSNNINNNINKNYNFKGYNLPVTMDFTTWGTTYFNEDYINAIIIKPNSNLIYYIKLYDNYQEVELKLNGQLIIKFIDTLNNAADLNTFSRIIENQEYIFINGELIVKKVNKKASYLKSINKNSYISHEFLTLDLETRTIDGIMIPYCVSMYDGYNTISFYLSDYKDSNEMLETSIKYLMKRKYDNYKIYLHNFSYFDGIFLFKILSNLSNNIRPIIREGRLIDIRFTFLSNNNNYTLYFRDSYLLLPSSLKKLAINFKVENKGIFPYKFINHSNINLNYIGNIPEFIYFDNITIEEYNHYCKQFHNKLWNLRNETIKYCEQDCITLYQIIDKFNHNIFYLFRVDIHKYPTLSSLAFGIYRSNFLKMKYNIPLIDGKIYDFIKQSYSGGSVDVFKPYGQNIYHYDVNSLYPYVMKQYLMPVGNPIYFEGDILKMDSNAFGFFEVKVTTPDNLNIPILQTKLKLNNIIKTISPLGTWTGVYFSEEIKNAMKYGYKFEILRGYLFEKANIFSEYVDLLYELKVNSLKDTPDYIISKLLLNSLYGRLGMNPKMENHIIVESNETINIINKYQVTNIIHFNNGKELVSFFYNNDNDTNSNLKLNISVPISSAVTSYARIHMSQFKCLENNNLYYTDTDSLDLDKPLDNKYIGKELGQMKLEHIFNEVVFIAPKVYGGIINTGKEIIKIKGSKNIIDYESLKSLLNKDIKLEINQDKWYRNISQGTITIKNEIYTLMVTDSKRKLIYNENNQFIDTSPILLNNGKIE